MWLSRHLPRIGLAALLLIVAIVSLRRALKEQYDFHYFYWDAKYVWEHGVLNPDLDHPDPRLQRQLPFYLPVVPLLLAPLAAGGLVVAALLWTAGHLLTLTYSLAALRPWAKPPPAETKISSEMIVGLACLLALPAIFEMARFNQISFLVLALVLAGTAALERGQSWRAGALLGLATVLKLLPAVFLVWLALKRQWRALAVGLATIGIVALGPCLLAFGPQKTLEYHQQWWTHNFRGAPAQGMMNAALREHFIDHRNQAIPAVFARLFWVEHPYRAPWQPFHLSETACRRLAYGFLLFLAGALFWRTRRGQTGLTEEILHAETAAYCLAMLVFSPLLRQYYLIWALPALVLFSRNFVFEKEKWPRYKAALGLGFWLVGMLAWLSPVARTYGVHLWMLIALGVLLLRQFASRRASPLLSPLRDQESVLLRNEN